MALPTKVCLATSIPGPKGTTGNSGTNGASGTSASTTLTADFTMPAQTADGNATVADSSVFSFGEIIFLALAGYLKVDGIPDSVTLTLRNLRDDGVLDYPDNAASGTIIPIGAKLTPGGQQGPTGSIGGIVAGGDLQGNYPNPTLIPTGTPGVYGDGTTVPQITTDAAGRVTNVTPVGISFPAGSAPGGPAGGDLTGTYPNPTLAASGVVAGAYGTSSAWPIITFDAKGRATAASVASPAFLTRVGLLGSASVNFNTTADQAITMASSKFRITHIIITDPSVDFSMIAPSGGIYTAPAKTGNIIVAAAQTYNTMVTTVDFKELTLDTYPLASLVVVPTLYFSLSVSVIPAATAVLHLFGEKYD